MKEQYLLNSQKEPMTLSIRKSEEVSTLSQDQKENIAMFVHDFKNPLAIMKSTIQFYEDSFPADSEGMEISQNLKRNIDEITKSIQLFLEFSKAGIDAPRDSGLISLINNALKSVERSAAEITKEFPKEDIIIKVDSLLFENIITQILRNSLESSENPISIVVELTQSRKFVNIIISDNGDGIPETIKDTIMDPFVSTKPYHLGLGLTLAKYYLAEIRGQVSILKSDSDGTKLMIQILK